MGSFQAQFWAHNCLLDVTEVLEQLEYDISMFADDTEIYAAIYNNIADSQRLQADLNSLTT